MNDPPNPSRTAHSDSERLRDIAFDDYLLFTRDEFKHLRDCWECFQAWTDFMDQSWSMKDRVEQRGLRRGAEIEPRDSEMRRAQPGFSTPLSPNQRNSPRRLGFGWLHKSSAYALRFVIRISTGLLVFFFGDVRLCDLASSCSSILILRNDAPCG